MFSVERREVRTIKNYHGRPRYGKEIRWYILKDGQSVTTDHNGFSDSNGIYFTRKKDAKEEIEKLEKGVKNEKDIGIQKL